jgi:hypothetical protein
MSGIFFLIGEEIVILVMKSVHHPAVQTAYELYEEYDQVPTENKLVFIPM